MYYIYGNEDFIIDEKIKEIINNNLESKVFHFNSDVKINDVINQISSFSLFDSKKILVFYNFPFLLKSNDNETKAIINSIKFKPSSTILIFTSEKINEKDAKNELLDFIKKEALNIECEELNDKQIEIKVKEQIKNMNATISEIDLIYFLSKVPNKLSIIFSELEKLVSLDKNISKNNIDNLVQKYDLSSVYDFVNAFQSQNYDLLFQVYNEKINQGDSIQNLISQLSNVLEICSRIYSLKKSGLSLIQIEKEMNKHSFVIKKNNDFLESVGNKKINKLIKNLSELDSKIKIGLVDEQIGFERFLLEVIKEEN